MMSGKSRDFVRRVALGFVIALAIGTMTGVAEAGVGTVLKTVGIPDDAKCAAGTDTGTAVAIVPGGRAGFPKIPILLVTSCGGQLFLLDPSTDPATRKTTILITGVTGTPRALTLRADKGDLLACQVSGSGTSLYSIDFSTLNTVPDGTAAIVRSGPAGSTCAGIAWDSSDKTIYQTGVSSGVNVVFHFGESSTGTPPSVPAGCPPGDSVTGLTVAGTSSFVACSTPILIADQIRQLYKVDGTLVRVIPPLGNLAFAPGNLAYDVVSFGSQFKDALWTKVTAQLVAVEIPGGTGGQVLGAPVLFPAACPAIATYFNEDGSSKDTDGDALLDCWEDGTLWSDGLPGIRFNGIWPEGGPPYSIDGRDVTLCVETNGIPGIQAATECASPTVKDIFVEIDYMDFHRPDPVAVSNVVAAFANAPVADGAHPTYPGPIRLHVQIDEQVPEIPKLALVPCTPPPDPLLDANFDTLKTQRFGTATERTGTPSVVANRINAKSFAFHYGLFVHNQSSDPTTPNIVNTASGCAEVGGNDFIVSLGSWGVVNAHNVGTTDQQAGTFMHELGHNLGLRHGGADNVNCKPNYQSVMNYVLQFNSTLTGRPLDYSRQLLATLSEGSLIETNGVGALPVNLVNGKVAFGPQSGIPSKAVVATVAADGSIDWNRNGSVSATSVARDLNNLSIAGCPALPGTFPANAEVLNGFNDWANINLNFRASVDFAGGATSTIDEKQQDGTLDITLDEALALSRDIIDIKPNDPNNTLNRGSSQVVNVAMFSRRDDQGLTEFDARDLDPATITLRGTGGATWALPVKRDTSGIFLCKVQDVNGDGLPDLVCQFDFAKNTPLSLGEKKAVLEATTFFGAYHFHSSDSIKVLR